MECMLYDGRDAGDFDSMFHEYREGIKLSDGKVRCSETGVVIPEGFPYALCEGLMEAESEEEGGHWEPYPQAIEIWRLLRSMSLRNKACFLFGGVYDELEYLEDTDDPQAGKLIAVKFRSIHNRVKERYAVGKLPRLHPSEKESLESGRSVSQLPLTVKEAPNALTLSRSTAKTGRSSRNTRNDNT
jgi:hypothetical protein